MAGPGSDGIETYVWDDRGWRHSTEKEGLAPLSPWRRAESSAAGARSDRDDLQQTELPRAARHQPRHVRGHGEPALHVGDAGPVAAVAVDAKGSGRRGARREDRVVVAEEED